MSATPAATPELPEGYLLRRPTPDDAEAVARVMIAVDIDESGKPDTSVQDVLDDWELPRFSLDRDAWIVVSGPTSARGEVVAYAWVWDRIPHVDVQGDLYVHPGHKGRGIEAVLLGILERRTAEHVASAPSGETVRLGVFAKAGSTLASELQGRGYDHVRTFLRMTIDLKHGYPETPVLDGIEIRGFRRGVDELALHRTIEEAFADHYRFAPEPHEEWVSRRTGHAEFDPTLWRIAWQGDEAVAGILPYQFEDLSWVRELGVRPRWRGLGIGRALLLETFRDFERRGRSAVSLGVDAENASGATRLYESVGMREEQRHDLFQWTAGTAR
ncbi:MAG TPA: GNAT family N-acetyltransferase [Candidatus Eisenbacteria bacterium]|nr:GNAT family N-acetyltransferase [Candidatus Eisenbacteria bacterium]